MKHKGAIIGLVIIVAAIVFCAVTFKGSLMNLVPFADARAATDSTVQIIGAPVDGSMNYSNGALHFDMKDERGDVMPVVFKGPKPEDLDTAMTKATKITAQGCYNKTQGTFEAAGLQVKCPSKYDNKPGGAERSYGAK
jgi:cytochrome c-type biogenesis protein CcmE